MHRRLLALAPLLVALPVLGCGDDVRTEDASSSEAGGTPYEVIREAPDFALETLSGDSITTADLADREAILMNFWASWCEPCRAEMPELIELHEAYDSKGLTVLGVTVNDLPRDSREFAEEMGIPYRSAIGTSKMLEDFAISPWLPTTILVVDGKVVREWIGPKTRADFEYPIKVALGLAPPIGEVTKTGNAEGEER